jgi:hypothetical protein
MATGDFVLFHAVIHARLFAAAQILSQPFPMAPTDERYTRRFPSLYVARVDVWVPLVTDGPKTSEIAPKRAMGAINSGRPYAKLSVSEYRDMVNELAARPTAETRPGRSDT